jgi:hypothetical protein
VDTRYHFIRENIEDGIIKMEFVKSIDNDSDIFTKNVNHEIYEKHARKFFGEIGIWNLNEHCKIGRVLEISLTFIHTLVLYV